MRRYVYARRFVIDPRRRNHGALIVRNAQGIDNDRPNKLAAGMSATKARAEKYTRPKKETGRDVLRLVVKGTTDALNGYSMITTHGLCACCGQRDPRKKILNEYGRARLASLRKKSKMAS